MSAIWNDINRNQIERQIWLRVMAAQHAAGVDIPDQAIADYAQAIATIADSGHELDTIDALERETGHDLYARLRYFNDIAGHQHAHRGLTSADVVENALQAQIMGSCELLIIHGEQLVWRLVDLVRQHSQTVTVGRTHGRPAQLTTAGKRAADWLSELSQAMMALSNAMENYPLRGIRGAVGTRDDLAQLLADTAADTRPGPTPRTRPERGHAAALALHWSVTRSLDPDTEDGGDTGLTTGQTYPRSQDLGWASAAAQLAAACTTITTNIRLLTLLDLATEQPAAGQVGSSAMPHKTNPRYSERVHSLNVVARGYQHMLQDLAGGQWFEGDVSTSAARRVALPGLFHAVDACLANAAYALDRVALAARRNDQDVTAWAPFLASGQLLAACVDAGLPREQAHELIQTHARAALQRGGSDVGGELIRALSQEATFPLSLDQLLSLLDLDRAREWLDAGAGQAARGLADSIEAVLDPRDPAWPGDLL
jgi:adenylosuccinate lyase